MIELPDRVVVPLGRAVSAEWDPTIGQRVVTVAVPGVFVGLTEEEHAIWSAAATGVSKEQLIREARVDGPGTTYNAVQRYGLLAEIGTEPDLLLREATGLRLLTHSRVGVDPRYGTVVGDPDGPNVRLSPVGMELYARSAGSHSLAAVAVLVATQASDVGVNDPEIIRPQRLARRALAEFFPLVRDGLASFGVVEGNPS